ILGVNITGNTTGIQLTNNVIRNTNTNGIALDGVTGHTPTDNLIEGNLFEGNHRHAMWFICGEWDGTTACPGGQLGIFIADNVTIRQNMIRNGWCDNCPVHAVMGIELSNGTASPLHNVQVYANLIAGESAWPIFYSGGGSADGTCLIQENLLVNNGFD